jgi:3alpha(or 20beta)-hydroxysteroid dehydrogenase
VPAGPALFDLRGKVAVVTGGNGGIGLGMARGLARAGARVVVAARNGEKSRSAARELQALGTDAIAIAVDVADEDSVNAMVAETVARWSRLDILVNNAGILRWERMADTSFESWNEVLAVNQTGVFLGMRAVAPQMKEQRAGSIVNISSVGGLSGASACFAYAATKWAVRGMTKGAAIELGPHGIKVNSIHPGIIDTPMMGGTDLDRLASVIGVPLQRYAQPEEVAKLALWLVSDDNSYSTGAEFVIDGGQTA